MSFFAPLSQRRPFSTRIIFEEFWRSWSVVYLCLVMSRCFFWGIFLFWCWCWTFLFFCLFLRSLLGNCFLHFDCCFWIFTWCSKTNYSQNILIHEMKWKVSFSIILFYIKSSINGYSRSE
jgi:hypothetical protein